MTSTAEVENGDRTALYRIYDESGVLLYVGITKNPKQRWAQHAADKAWWQTVASCTVQWHETRREAEQAEAKAIRVENPACNISGKTRSDDAASAVVSLTLDGPWRDGLDVLRRQLLADWPGCSREAALVALLDRELWARGLLGDPPCLHTHPVRWPEGLKVTQDADECAYCRSCGTIKK